MYQQALSTRPSLRTSYSTRIARGVCEWQMHGMLHEHFENGFMTIARNWRAARSPPAVWPGFSEDDMPRYEGLRSGLGGTSLFLPTDAVYVDLTHSSRLGAAYLPARRASGTHMFGWWKNARSGGALKASGEVYPSSAKSTRLWLKSQIKTNQHSLVLGATEVATEATTAPATDCPSNPPN